MMMMLLKVILIGLPAQMRKVTRKYMTEDLIKERDLTE